MRDTGINAALTDNHLFADADAALEWAEEHVLRSVMGDSDTGKAFPLAGFDLMANMQSRELETIQSVLEPREWPRGSVAFNEGDAGDDLFLIVKGNASVRMHMPGQGRSMRLVTFSPGTIFGELALLDHEARSAAVQADTDLTCLVLSRDGFLALSSQHPALAIKLMTNLSRELSGRLRRANRTLYQLES